MTIIGANFRDSAVVEVAGTERHPTSIEPTRIELTLETSDVATVRDLAITVVNPDGTPSEPTKLPIVQPTPDPPADPTVP